MLDGPHGVMGVDVASRTIDGHHWTVVQLLLDDDHPLFDRTLLDAPIVAEVRTHGHGPGNEPVALALEPFDHDRFRQQLQREHAAGESTTRGVLVRTGGELPPPYVRLAFLPIELAADRRRRPARPPHHRGRARGRRRGRLRHGRDHRRRPPRPAHLHRAAPPDAEQLSP